jgi:hypothetical protein
VRSSRQLGNNVIPGFFRSRFSLRHENLPGGHCPIILQQQDLQNIHRKIEADDHLEE